MTWEAMWLVVVRKSATVTWLSNDIHQSTEANVMRIRMLGISILSVQKYYEECSL